MRKGLSKPSAIVSGSRLVIGQCAICADFSAQFAGSKRENIPAQTEYKNLVLLIRKSLKGSLFPEPEFLSYQVRTNYAGFKLLSGFENEASSGSFRLP